MYCSFCGNMINAWGICQRCNHAYYQGINPNTYYGQQRGGSYMQNNNYGYQMTTGMQNAYCAQNQMIPYYSPYGITSSYNMNPVVQNNTGRGANRRANKRENKRANRKERSAYGNYGGRLMKVLLYLFLGLIFCSLMDGLVTPDGAAPWYFIGFPAGLSFFHKHFGSIAVYGSWLVWLFVLVIKLVIFSSVGILILFIQTIIALAEIVGRKKYDVLGWT